MYKVQEVAKMAGVSVRTLHHYDSIGLMKPSNIGSNRYRYYNDGDLKLLQHILFFKEIGFSLKKIQELVAEGFDPEHGLIQHAEFLRQKKERIEKLIENAEMTLRESKGEETLTNEQRFSAFASDKASENIKDYKTAEVQTASKVAVAAGVSEAVADHGFSEEPFVIEEAAPADGFALVEELVSDEELAQMEEIASDNTSTLDEAPASNETISLPENSTSVEKTASVEETADAEEMVIEEEVAAEENTDAIEEAAPAKEEEDLEEINREGNRIYNAVASLMHLPPETDLVQKEMEAYYILLNRFYNCNPKMFRGLGDLYAADSRFSNNIDQHGTGLSKYLKDAMYIYAEGIENA